MSFKTRFAPSPTGPLHLGHAYSALLAHDMARAAGGAFVLRIDDLDQSRARPEWEDQIYRDLEWLGITWDGPVGRQSDHFDDYRAQITALAQTGLLYPCACKRKDLIAAASAPQEGAQYGPDGLIYPGICCHRPWDSRQASDAIRLNLAALPADLSLSVTETGPEHSGVHAITRTHLMQTCGDPILARPNMAASYHFSVVLDDAASAITHVIRGADLFEASAPQALFQQLLGLPTPIYHHHRLIRDEAGKRLAKRDDARAIATYRDAGLSPADIRQKLGL